MRSSQNHWVFLVLAAGCNHQQDQGPITDLASTDAARPSFDLARPDLSVKPGWNQVVVSSGLRLNAVWGSGASDVYAVGLGGTIFHSIGDDVWTQQNTGRTYEVTSVFGSSSHDVYAVDTYGVLHSTGDGHWSVLAGIPADPTGTLTQVWMSSPSDVYFSGSTSQAVPADPTGGVNIMRWNSPTLTSQYAAAQHNVAGFWGTDPTDLWAVGSYESGGASVGLVLHSAGTGAWTQQDFEPEKGTLYEGTLSAVWSSSKTNVYAAAGYNFVTSNSGIFRCSGAGTAWRRETDKMNSLAVYGLWGSGPTDVWAVGSATDGPNYNGAVLRSQGDGQWAADPDLAAAKLQGYPLYGVWGSRFGDVYVVGQAGIIFHKRE